MRTWLLCISYSDECVCYYSSHNKAYSKVSFTKYYAHTEYYNYKLGTYYKLVLMLLFLIIHRSRIDINYILLYVNINICLKIIMVLL